MEFTYRKRHTIVPSPPSPPHVVPLSILDQTLPPVFTSILYFFTAPSVPPASEYLTTSLAQALAVFPPLAGRLVPRIGGAGLLDVECHNQGAVFWEAHTLVTLDALLPTGNGDPKRGGSYEMDPLWYPLAPNPDDEEASNKPVLLVQLTRLGCGGLVVAMLLHHSIVDGTAQTHFIVTWAELTRGQPITAHPHLDRACVQARASSRVTFPHEEFTIRNTATATGGAATAAGEPAPAMACRVFEFLSDDIRALKAHANTGGGDAVSSFQALAAHIWKHVTKARGPQDAAQVTKLGWPINGRNRFDPPFPANYFGNVVFFGCTEARVGDLIEQPLGQTADLIRSVTRRRTDEYLRSAIGLLVSQGSPALVARSFVTSMNLIVGTWTSFIAYEIDWGWGCPVYFTRLFPNSFTSFATLLPHSSGPGAVSVPIVLPRELHLFSRKEGRKKARGPQDASQVTKLGWPVNGRNRFDPPLPANYFGNVVFRGCTEARVGDLIEQSLGQTADLIRSATRRCTDEYLRSALALLIAQGSPALAGRSFETSMDLIVGPWSGFKAYEIDWGWGRPVYFTHIFPNSISHYATLLPHPSGPGAVNVSIILPRPQMDALLLDTAFHPVSKD